MIEVLLALAIFGLGVMALSAAYVNVLEGIERARSDRVFEQEMKWVREQVLAQSDLKELEKGGDTVSQDYGKVQWEVAVEPTEIADLFSVSLHVQMEGKDDQTAREATQSFMLLRPLWSEPLDREKLRNESKERIEKSRRDSGVLSQRGNG